MARPCRVWNQALSSEQRLGYAVAQVPHRFTGGRPDKGRHVEPLEAVVAEGDRALALGGPHRAQDRLQPEAVLIGAEHLDRHAGMGGGLLGDRLRQLFLKAWA